MERRQFLETCAAISGMAGVLPLPAWAKAAVRLYDRAQLVDVHGAPLKVRTIAAFSTICVQTIQC